MSLTELAIVTGATRGLGRALALALSKKMKVLCIANSDLKAFIDETANNDNIMILDLDLSQKEFVEPLRNWLTCDGRDYRVKYLVHNAGVLDVCRLDMVSYEQILHSFSVNTFAPMLINQVLFSLRQFSKKARMIYVTSSAARLEYGRVYASLALYSATKAALNESALIQKRECEVLDYCKDLQIARVYPGVVKTDMQKNLQASLQDPKLSELKLLQAFEQSMLQEEFLPACILPAEVSARFLQWVLSLSDDHFLQVEEFDIYKTSWLEKVGVEA